MDMNARRTTALGVSTVVAVGLLAAHGPAAVAAPKRADLAVTTVGAVPASAQPGGTFAVTATVANRGRGAAPATRLSLQLSTDRRVGRGDIAVGSTAVKKLRAGKKQAVRVTATIPVDTRGAYWLIACADAAKKVKEPGEKDNCRPSRTRVTLGGIVPPPGGGGTGGRLTGTLSFTDAGQGGSAPTTTTWNRTASATVDITVDGAWDSKDTTFVSNGSTYTASGQRTSTTTSTGCLSEETRQQSANATFVYSGDRFKDEIHGHMARIDGSEISLGLHMRYQQQLTKKTTPQGEDPDCEASSTTEPLSNGLEVAVVELEQVSRTATSITYRPVSWLADMGTTSEWDKVEGQLVLTLP
jgi:CARDB protein